MKDGWKIEQMGDLCSIKSGKSNAQDAEENGPYAFFDRSKKIKKSNRFLYDCEALIIPGEGAEFLPRHFIGKFDLHQRAYALLDFSQRLDTRFLFYYLTHFKDYFVRVAVGATVKSLRLRHFEQLPVPVAPLPEQQRIVAILDEAFDGLATAKANAEQNLANARALFESHLDAVFRQRGEGWVETIIDKLSTNLDRQRVPITKNVRTSGEYPYYGASGIVDYVGDYIFEGDTLLVSEDGANLLARSTPIAFSVSGKYWVNNHAHILKFEDMSTQRFVEFYLESIKLDEYITGAAQPKLNQKALNSIPIPIPSNVEAQASIVEGIEMLSEETQNLTPPAPAVCAGRLWVARASASSPTPTQIARKQPRRSSAGLPRKIPSANGRCWAAIPATKMCWPPRNSWTWPPTTRLLPRQWEWCRTTGTSPSSVNCWRSPSVS
jgi:type I restriction enzyme, S subunit